ncbi:tyrosine-type recombinase/integrase [Desulfovirgula thermocuniculi]|uniref:tyrosine-type recombinase/integrase n=1 Tax=Desulfovirgula thermocuniculi TaxID=348842 RepID=UPI000402FF20|nr:tyrosine-type recombinase/integrase [Desulfovirgula thermocuniculi]
MTRARKKRVISLPPEFKNRVAEIPRETWTFGRALESFARHHRVKGTRESTIKWYMRCLDDFKRFCEEARGIAEATQVRREDIEEYILSCREQNLKPTSINGRIRSVRAFFNFLESQGALRTNPAKGISLVRHTEPVVPTFTEDHVRRLLEQPDLSTFAGLRDYTIMLLLLDTGVRIGELLRARREDVVSEGGYPAYLVIRNPKNQKERVLPLSPKTQGVLRLYSEALDRLFGPDSPLFPNQEGEPISKRTVQQRIAAYGRRAGLSGVRVSPHTFRHTFAKFWIMEGGDVLSLQEILGHADLEMVRRYARMFTPDLKRKHERFSPVTRKGF